MREIKFRAWDTKYNKMIPVFTNYAGWQAMDGLNVWHDDRYFKLQYTDLKDRNGKEIYEGDILHKDAYWRWYVGFADGCFVAIPCEPVQRVNWLWPPVNDFVSSDFEVIGNIYENPKLLKAMGKDE